MELYARCRHMAAKLPAEWKPAAIIPISAGASRSHTVELGGRFPVLHFHGVHDDIVPPTIWAGALPIGQLAREKIAPPKGWRYGTDMSASTARSAGIEVGCPNKWGDVCPISSDGYFYDPLARTVSGATGTQARLP